MKFKEIQTIARNFSKEKKEIIKNDKQRINI